ncbi:signal peptidase I [bacterium]|nr:signal peptidase I [bacterium]
MNIKKQKKVAKELLATANKIYHYRRDMTSEADLSDLDDAVSELDTLCRDKEAAADLLMSAMNRVDTLLRKIGGKMYPKTFWNDNLEVALVAAIIVIGIRTFFFQPFIIPTNSMYPTYSGMDSVIYGAEMEAPSAVSKFLRLATLGARHRSIVAESSGDVYLLVQRNSRGGPALSRVVRSKGVFTQDEYLFQVGDAIQALRVPKQFDLASLLEEKFGGFDTSASVASSESPFGAAIPIPVKAEVGEDLLRFDVILGDALFVDRISYHFDRPEAGDPFVFRTDDIQHEIAKFNGGDKTPKYYIKRIGGIGGETIEIRDSGLFVNGEPRIEVEAFGRNARQEGEHPGYINEHLMGEGMELNIPDCSYVALGDNSASSLDSRYWGYVPDKSVIGKAIFIYYPFTKRWGLAE